VARENLAAAGLSERVTVLVGPALESQLQLTAEGPFDAVFIDADKGNYDQYGRWAAQVLRPGGLLIGDNAYYFGNLLEPTSEAAAMRRFHQEAVQDFDTVCIPTPDGLLLGIKR
jgi:caffeoyl-CoA O-methyltransferase